jgi:hypothetical protein
LTYVICLSYQVEMDVFTGNGVNGGPSYRRSHHLLYRTLEGRVVCVANYSIAHYHKEYK